MNIEEEIKELESLSPSEEAINIVLNELDKKDKQIRQLNNRCKNLDREAQSYLEELAGDSGLRDRTIQMQDRVIDMMANQILYDDMKTETNKFVTSEEIIEYFYKKAEEEEKQ